MIEHASIINIIRDKREEHEYIHKTFKYNNINYLMFLFYHKYLFNMNLDYLKIRITLILMRKMVNERIIYNKLECK